MRIRRVGALVATVVAVLLIGSPAALAAVPGPAATPTGTATPASAAGTAGVAGGCPGYAAPGPPVDTSEVPKPGQATPAPLPVPDPPVGGDAMATCGTVVPPGAPAPPTVDPVSYVLADLDSGQVLAARVPHARLRPASLMKTLTGLLVARRLPMDEVLTGTPDDANQEGTRVGVGPGGQYTIRQLLDGMLMASGNDIAHALAVRLTGSVDGTVALMNRTAADLGADDTRAATPSGLDGPGMSTSAYDLASIFRVAMREAPFAQAVGTRQMPFPGYGAIPGFVVNNDNKLLANYPGAIGGKTGFTDDARHTYIGAAERNGRRLVIVLMRGEQRPVPMFEQGAALLDYGFALPRGEAVGQLTDAAPGRTTAAGAASGVDGTTDPGASAPADASGSARSSRWQTPLAVTVIVVVALLAAGLRLRHGRH